MSNELNALIDVIRDYFIGDASHQIDALNVRIASLQNSLHKAPTEEALANEKLANEKLRAQIKALREDNATLVERNGKLQEIQGGKDRQLACYISHLSPVQKSLADAEWRNLQNRSKKAKAAARADEQAAQAPFAAPAAPCIKTAVVPEARPIQASHVSGHGGLVLSSSEIREWDHS